MQGEGEMKILVLTLGLLVLTSTLRAGESNEVEALEALRGNLSIAKIHGACGVYNIMMRTSKMLAEPTLMEFVFEGVKSQAKESDMTVLEFGDLCESAHARYDLLMGYARKR